VAEWACVLCAAGGRESGPKHGRSAVCRDHHASLKAQGRFWCGKGAHVRPEAERATGKCVCRACDSERRKARYERNAERERAYQRARYHANPLAHRAKAMAWRAANPERAKAMHARAMRAYARRNRDKVRAWNRASYQRTRTRILEAKRARYQRAKLAAFQRLFRGAPRAR